MKVFLLSFLVATTALSKPIELVDDDVFETVVAANMKTFMSPTWDFFMWILGVPYFSYIYCYYI